MHALHAVMSPSLWGGKGKGSPPSRHNLTFSAERLLSGFPAGEAPDTHSPTPEMAACMAHSLRSLGSLSVAANSNCLIRQHRAPHAPSTWLPCPSLISAARSPPCLHCQAASQSSSAADQPSGGLPPASTPRENTPEENVNQLGWLWDRSADATRKKLQAEKLRPKKCASPHPAPR